MSLREDMWKYEQITGESAEHVPIIKLGAFLDGYDMAIKALEQQPSEDCISRQAAIDAVNRLSLGEMDAVRLSMRIADYLNRIQPAQPTFDARDPQYNLPIGTDCISRQAAIEALQGRK